MNLSKSNFDGIDKLFLTCGPQIPGGPRRLLRGSATV
jgi:hypothetical protein